jgi:glycogen synthase
MDAGSSRGSGFLFRPCDAAGLCRAVDQAMAFQALPGRTREGQVRRVMEESRARFNHAATAREYISLYETMLRRPFLTS